MRTLFISPWVPEPLNTGGHQRIFHLLRGLAQAGDVTFVSATPGGRWNGAPSAFRSLCKEVFLFPKESVGWKDDPDPRLPVLIRRWKSRWKTLSRHFGTSEPLMFQWYRSAEGTELLERLCSQAFDLVWVEGLFWLGLLPGGLKTRVVVDLHDLEHQRLRRDLRIAKPGRYTLLNYWEFLKLRRFERRLPKGPREFVVCSETDKRILGGGERVWVAPNGVDMPALADESDTGASDPVLVFVGMMSYLPNVDGAQFFAREILPLIRREVPAVKLLLVGRDPDARVRDLHDDKTIFVTGTVPDVAPYLRQGTVAIAPLRVGGGTRIKILEAMAHRRPVVATSIGAEGLDVESGRELLIADSPSRFAAACVRLLRDRNLRQTLAARAFDLVRAKYEWSKIESGVGRIAVRKSGSEYPELAGSVPTLPPAARGQSVS